jgi:hypothetical protein
MRFRKKFGVLNGANLAIFTLLAILRLAGKHGGETSSLWTVLEEIALLAIPVSEGIAQALIYWDTKPDGLYARRIWRKKMIPWREISRISAFRPNQPSSRYLAIHYSRTAPSPDQGKIVVYPEHRQQFLAEIQKYAPHAIIEV